MNRRAAQVSGFTVLASVLAFGALFGLIGAIIGVPIAAGLQIAAEEITAAEELASPPQTLRSSSRRLTISP
jgi:predicted PurR-regulated permease PerM